MIKKNVRVHIARRSDGKLTAAYRLPTPNNSDHHPVDIIEIPEDQTEAIELLNNYIMSMLKWLFPSGYRFIIRYYTEIWRTENEI